MDGSSEHLGGTGWSALLVRLQLSLGDVHMRALWVCEVPSLLLDAAGSCMLGLALPWIGSDNTGHTSTCTLAWCDWPQKVPVCSGQLCHLLCPLLPWARSPLPCSAPLKPQQAPVLSLWQGEPEGTGTCGWGQLNWGAQRAGIAVLGSSSRDLPRWSWLVLLLLFFLLSQESLIPPCLPWTAL